MTLSPKRDKIKLMNSEKVIFIIHWLTFFDIIMQMGFKFLTVNYMGLFFELTSVEDAVVDASESSTFTSCCS